MLPNMNLTAAVKEGLQSEAHHPTILLPTVKCHPTKAQRNLSVSSAVLLIRVFGI